MDETPTEQTAKWNPAQLFGLRFAVIYFLAYFFPTPFTLPLDACRLTTASSWISSHVDAFWLRLDSFVGPHILQTGPIAYKPSGSSDSLYHWVTLFSIFMLALIGSLVWTAFDRKRAHYEGTYEFLRIVLRYSLAIILMGYGFNKVGQFPPLTGHDLFTRFGDETPTGILWNFMGSSFGYSIFSGVLEAGAGILLLFRRTTTLGSLLAVAVMLNVFLLNVFYDVSIKTAAFHYLVSGLVLSLPDLKRLLNVLVLNTPTFPRTMEHPIVSRKVRVTALSVKWILVGLLVCGNIADSVDLYKAIHNPMIGAWDVTSFKQNGAEVDPNAPNTGRWKTITFTPYVPQLDRFLFQLPKDRMFQFKYKDDGRTLAPEALAGTGNFTFDQHGDNLTIYGTLPGGPIVVELVRDKQLELANHHTHWIQEDWRPRDTPERPLPPAYMHNGVMMVETSN